MDQTGIGYAHGHVRIFIQQIQNREKILTAYGCDPQGSATAGKAERGATIGS